MGERELRIGNYFVNELGHDDKISGYYIHELEMFNNNPSYKTISKNFKPTLLTEELLVRFGFIKLDNEGYFYIHEECMGFKVSEDLKMVAWNNLHLHGVNIEYVHKLQNLFFAITNQELTIKNEH